MEGERRNKACLHAKRNTGALFAASAAMLLLSACGSSGSSTTHSTAATTPPTTATTTPAETGTSTTSASGSTGGTTAPGTTLKPGAQATVDWQPGSESNSPTFHLQISVNSIKQGTPAEMSGVELSKAQQGQTPYYVTLQVRNLGAGDAAAEGDDPLAEFQTIDDRGGQGQELTILGKYRSCETVAVPKHLLKNAGFSSCSIYMVGKGGSIAKVVWTGSGGDAFSENPIVWKAG
jgi:hypothetical protein